LKEKNVILPLDSLIIKSTFNMYSLYVVVYEPLECPLKTINYSLLLTQVFYKKQSVWLHLLAIYSQLNFVENLGWQLNY